MASTAIHEPVWLSIVRQHVTGVKFGTVQITVHEGRVTQVDATLRTRIDPKDGAVRVHSDSRAHRERGGDNN